MIRDGKLYFHGFKEDGNISGMLAYSIFPKIGANFIIYIAVEEKLRRNGRGTSIMNEFLDGSLKSIAKYTVLESDKPEQADNEEKKIEALRRLGWYGRLGFKIIDPQYIQPPVAQGKSPVPMNLLYHSKLGRRMSTIKCETIRDTMYREAYDFGGSFSDLENLLT